VIDRKYIGGSCPNIACLPSKNVLHSARIASYFRRGEEFGLPAECHRVDMAAVRARKRTMVSGVVNEMYLENYKQTGAELIFGLGRFIGPKTLEVALPGGKTRHLRGTKCHRQHWYAGCTGCSAWLSRCAATHAYRGA